MPPELVLQRLRPPDESGFAALVSLYDEAFPASERKPLSTLRRMLADEAYHLLLAHEAGQAIGLAIGRTLAGGTAALLEYMAVAPNQRGRGFGAEIFRATARILQAPPATLLLEVESDRVGAPDAALRARRKRFYRTLGAREINGLEWVMPTVATTEPPPMEMLAFTAAGSVPKAQLRQWLTRIYVEVYDQPAGDPRLQAMLEPLPDDVALL